MEPAVRQKATQGDAHRKEQGKLGRVFYQTTRKFCEDSGWPCSQELSLSCFLCLPLPPLSPFFLSPCLPSHRATLPYVLTPPTPPNHHTTHVCMQHTQTHTHTCLRSWLASSWQKALSLEATQPPPLFSQDFHLCRLALLATVHLSFLDASLLHPPGSQKMTGKAGRSPAHSLPVPKAGTLQS